MVHGVTKSWTRLKGLGTHAHRLLGSMHFKTKLGVPWAALQVGGRGGQNSHPAGRRATPTPQEWTQGSGALVGGGVSLLISVPQGWAQKAP